MPEKRSEMPAKQASEKTKSPRVFGPAQKPAKMFRAGLYARVSTYDQQTIPLQIRALREYAARRGWTTAWQMQEVGSGASERQLREKLLEAARRREIDVVLVWRLDRWGRSVADLLAALQTAASRCRLRLTDRGARSDDARRPGDGRATSCVRGVRKGDSAGAGPRRFGPRPAERQETGPAHHS